MVKIDVNKTKYTVWRAAVPLLGMYNGFRQTKEVVSSWGLWESGAACTCKCKCKCKCSRVLMDS